MQHPIQKFKNGFTLIEILVVVAIIALLLLISVNQLPLFLARANDSKRKSNLQELKIAIEQYHTDKGCYPPDDAISVCGSTNSVLAPYLKEIPCDPVTKLPYAYAPDGCISFKLYTYLFDLHDPDIEKVDCSNGCGPVRNPLLEPEYNYGVGSGNVDIGILFLRGTLLGGTCIPESIGGGCPSAYKCESNGIYCTFDPNADE